MVKFACHRATIALAAAMWSMAGHGQEALKIGAPTSLSGRYVAFGVQAKRGIEFAIEVWKATKGETAAGHPIELFMVDTQSDNALTVSTMNDLIQSRRVNIIIGPDGSDIAAAAVPPWKRAGDRPVWILPGSSGSKTEEEVGADRYFFHTFAWAYDYHKNSAQALLQSIGPKKRVAFVYSDGAYGRSQIGPAQKYMKQAGFEVVDSQLVREGASEFNSAIVKMRATHPDVVYVLMQTTDVIQFTKQLNIAKAGIKYQISTAAPQLPEWQNAVGDAQNCWIGVTTWTPGLGLPGDPREPKLFPDSNTWEAAFRARYKREPGFLDVGYYVSTMLALLAVDATKSVNRDAVTDWLSKQDYKTPLGSSSKFSRSDITPHQAFSKVVLFQRVKGTKGFESAVFYPTEIAKAKLQPCN
ncbi:hypothetical protein BZM26_00755 [Paraburkholderia strydomiana]|nr:hypothetical protein BZM26_00755 [Paraburkholderia strydomiana]